MRGIDFLSLCLKRGMKNTKIIVGNMFDFHNYSYIPT